MSQIQNQLKSSSKWMAHIKAIVASIVLLTATVFPYEHVFATHAAGADLSYKCLGGLTYEVTATFYRDCAGISESNSISINYKSATCGYNLSFNAFKDPNSNGQEITTPCSSNPTTCAGGSQVGIKRWVYKGTITLPAACTDWMFSYGICCRNCAITTIQNPCANSTELYVEALLNNLNAPCNNSPAFTATPIAFACIGQNFNYTQGIVDPDGDSLVCELITPKINATTNITYIAPASTTSPIASSTPLTVNPTTGNLNFTPSQIQIGILAIRVKEYRNGVQIGSTIRDMQIYTQFCNNSNPTLSGINGTASFSINTCANSNLCFVINSYDSDTLQNLSLSYLSNIPGATFTTIAGSRPKLQFCWTPNNSHVRVQPYTFTVIVQDNACPINAVQSFTYSVYVGGGSSSVSGTQVSCFGGSNGTATVTPSGGVSPYTYLWNNGNTTAAITNLIAGNYTVTVTDLYGCTSAQTKNVTQPALPLSATVATTVPASCFGSATGSATLNVSGGTGPYSFLWSNGSIVQNPSGLNAGSYSVLVTDFKGCTATVSATIGQPLAALNITSNAIQNVSCFGGSGGAIDISVSGGSVPYTYNWSNGANSQDISGLSAGTYSVTVTDVNGCTKLYSNTLSQPAVALSSSLVSSQNISCYGLSNGSINISTSGGTTPYSYLWSNGATTEDISNILSGSYTVTITDNNGCTTTRNVILSQPAAILSVSSSSVNAVSCFGGSNGAISLNVAGGTSPYIYSWNTGATSQNLSGLSSGTYTIVVTDAHGCSAQQSSTVSQPAAALSASVTMTQFVSCYGGNNGALSSAASGGTGPYTYHWNTGAVTPSISNLAAGGYTVTVTDFNGCTFVNSGAVSQPAQSLSTALSQTQPVSCFGGNNAIVTLTVSGGTPAYSYNWSNGVSTQNLNGVASGNYTVTVSDANGCTRTGNIFVTQPGAPLAVSTSVSAPVSCYGGANGTASTAVAGGTSPYNYLWSNGSTGSSATGLSAGSYSVVVTDSRGCTSTSNVIITQPVSGLATSISSSSNVTCYNAANGAINLATSGGTSPYTYSWNNGATTQNISSLGTGSYSVTVTDFNGCTSQAGATITQPSAVLSASSSVTSNISCFSGNNGAVTLSVSGGTTAYNYLWSTGATTQNVSGLPAGSYNVTVTDANGCLANASATIVQPAGALSTNVNISQQVSCFGGNNGSIDLSVAGGTTPYIYIWNNGSTSQDISGLSAGSYTVSISDANGCNATQTATVAQPSGVLSGTANVSQQVSCNSGANGTIGLVVSGGTSPYSYIWNSGATTQSLSGVVAGTYTVTITDANGCFASGSATVTQPAAALSVIPSVNQQVSCFGGTNGSINTLVSGGTLPVTYSWSTGVTTQNLSGLSAGTYTVTATDANGCVSSASSFITQPAATLGATANVLQQVSCYSGSNGSIGITTTGGTSPYTYLWNNGINTQNLAGVQSGTYTVTITDANGCIATQSASISQPAAALLGSAAASQQVSCFGGANGNISLVVTGGTPAYTYVWSNSATTNSLNNVPSGTYSVTITDAHGCTSTASAIVTQPSAALSAAVTANQMVSCYSGNNGSATITPAGGTAPYNYQWSNGQFSQSIGSLSAGAYSVTVSDLNGCTFNAGVTITQPQASLSASSTIMQQVLCFGGNNASVNLSVSGGTSPYVFNWNNGATTQNISGIAAGNYSATITDIHGCTTTASAAVSQPVSALSSTAVVAAPVSCFGNNSGSIQLNVSGGTAPYSYIWNNGALTANINNLIAGTYSVTVTDAHGCSSQSSVTVTQPSAPLAVTSGSITAVLCNGGSSGSVSIVVSGGTAPYTYNWNNGAVSQNISGLTAGTYSVVVTDVNGCSATVSALVSEPVSGLSANINQVRDVSCFAGANGFVDLEVAGGTSPYTYLWNTGSTNQDLNGVATGVYSVTVTDANGCSVSLSTTVGQPAAALSVTSSLVQPVLCYAGSSGFINSFVTGGTGPYTYLWNTGSTLSNISGLSAGTYTLTVTDSKGCTSILTETISQPVAALNATTQVTSNISCFAGNNGAIDLTVIGGTSPYSYLWSTGSMAQDINGLAAGSYSVTITDVNGCTTFTSASIVQPPGALSLSLAVTQQVSCYGGSNGSINLSVGGGTSPYSYVWSTGDSLEDISGLFSGIYTVLVTDANGCMSSQSIGVSQPIQPLLITSSTIQPVLCNAGNSGSVDINVIGGTLPYTFNWSNGATSEDIASLSAGSYSVTITDANGCSTGTVINISEPSQALAINSSGIVNVGCFGGNTGSLNTIVSGGTSPYAYLWSNGSVSQNLNGIGAGNYTVTVTDLNGCTAVTSVAITQPSAALGIAVSATQNVSCFAGNNGSISSSVSGGTNPYTYVWSNGQTTSSISSLTSGNYSVTVTDNNGCSVLASAFISQPSAALSAGVSAVNPALCFGGNTGSVSVQVAGGTSPYSYNWSNGASSQNISNLLAGTYSLTITDAHGCSYSLSQLVSEPQAALSSSIGSVQMVNCYGGNNGGAAVVVNGGTAPYSYLWNTGDISQSVAGLSSGMYSVIITDLNGCTLSDSVNISQPIAALSANASSQQQVSCFGGANGVVNVIATGGTGPYSYQWNNGSVSQTNSGLNAGTYNVIVTDANGCSTNDQVVVTQPVAAIAVVVNTVQAVNCYGGSNGSIAVSVSGGTPGYVYNWSNGSVTQNLNGLAAGNYSVVVTDDNGCTESSSASVSQPNAPLGATSLVTSNISCYSGNNGIIDLTVTGGTSPYQYLWNTGVVTEDLSGASAGNYQVTITDANGCTFISSAQITQPAGALSAALTSPQAVSCFGGANGSLQLSVNGGTLPYSYVWNTGATSQNISGLNSGAYTVTITDANGCNVSQSGLVSQPVAPLNIAVNSVDPVLCNAGNTGAIAISVSGGTIPYSYSWTNGFSGVSNTGLTAGSYGVVVVDQNGCADSTVILVSEPANALSASVNSNIPVLCYGGNNGALDITVAGGTAPYSYLWSNGSASEDISGLTSGNYQLTITDANGCDFNLSATISQPAAPLSATPVVTQQVQCFAGEDGIIDLTVSGGTGPYTYQWSNGSTDEDLNQLMAGVYTVTVTDINGCMVVAAEEVFEPVLPLTGTPSIVSNVFCNGGSNGAIDLSVTGGTAPYGYIWSTGDTTEDVSNLAVGTYSVTITDANGCSTMVTAGIGQPAQQLNASLLIQHVLCFNGTNGTIDVTPTGGTAPYTYQWNTGATSEDIGSLIAGTYTVVITDANGCTFGLNAVVNQPQSPLIPVVSVDQDVSCYGGSDGALNVAASGGTPPYVYLWSSGATTTGAINLPAGMYTVTVTDANGCNAIISQNVNQPLAPVNAILSVDQNVSCYGGDNGMVSAAVSGGTAPYTYLWSTGGTTSSISGLSAGTYTITVTDIKGCEFTTSTLVTEPASAVSISGSTTVANCLYGIGGTATAGAIGGTPAYTYQWSNGVAGSSITNVAPGSYTVTVTDANGCSASVGLIVGNESPVTINPGPTTICVGESTTLGVDSITGATYQWYYAGVALNGAVGNTFQTQAQGYYFVVVTSACGTFYSDSVTVTVNSVSDATINNNLMICPPETAQLNATGGTTYQWTPNAGLNFTNIPNPVASPTQSTVYSVVVTNDFGCSITMSVEVIIDCDTLFVPNGFSPNDDGVNDGYVIDGILNYPNNKFWVYNRWGNLVYKTTGYANQWNGDCNVQGIYWGTKVPAGTYFYILDLGDNSEKPRSGYLIIRY